MTKNLQELESKSQRSARSDRGRPEDFLTYLLKFIEFDQQSL